MGSLVAAETLFFYHSSPPKSTLSNTVLLHLLCGARASPGLLLPGRRPPALRGPPPRSSPSSEPQSGPGSWPPESVKQHRLFFFLLCKTHTYTHARTHACTHALTHARISMRTRKKKKKDNSSYSLPVLVICVKIWQKTVKRLSCMNRYYYTRYFII